jgi:UDP-N-acetylglucosamine 2-epimerase (non-hydrolysing)
MLDQVLELFEIVPDHDLDIIEARQTLTDVTVRALTRLSPLMKSEQADAVIVQGDTTTTFAGALAAFYHHIPVVHLEAGLRTGDPYSPFPEEINRSLTTRLATLHLAPTATNRQNLLLENVPDDSILITGNTVIDALLWTVGRRVDYGDPALEHIDADPRRMLLVTAHRRESWGRGMRSIGRALARIARADPNLLIVFPIHRNPVVREAITPELEGLENVVVVEPLPYGAFAGLMKRADVVLTDSGGIQEEAPSLGKPVLVMRDSTERPEAMHAGTVKLIGTDEDTIVGSVRNLFGDALAYAEMAKAVNPYGDGRAARRTVAALAHLFGEGPRVDEFRPLLPIGKPAPAPARTVA